MAQRQIISSLAEKHGLLLSRKIRRFNHIKCFKNLVEK